MKIGPFEVSRASRKETKPSTREIGATGTEVFSGLLSQTDYNAALQPPASYDIYDRMRNDGQVRAALTVIKLPILNADWKIEPASEDPEDIAIAAFIENDLMRGMSISWTDYLRQVLLMLEYGSMAFEKCWEIRDGLVHLRKLAPRLPRSITQWKTDSAGGLAGIEQSSAPSFTPVPIPVEKLLVFVNDLEGSNFRGVSVLRSAYKHHYYKDNLYRVQAIAIEKRAMGVDVGTLKGDAITEPHKQAMERTLMSLHAHEKQFMVEVDGQTSYRLETGSGGAGGSFLSPQEAIEHHDLRIVRSMIAEFVAMGAGSTGSLAMHRDKTSYLLLALGGHCNNIADTHNKHLIPQWINYNFPNVTRYPTLRYSRLEQRDVAVYAEAVQKLVTTGALTADETLEIESRELLSLPRRKGPRLPAAAPSEPDDADFEGVPTEEAVAAIRSLRAILKRRRETAEAEPEEVVV